MMPAKKSCGHKNGGTVSYGLLMCVGVSRTFVKACWQFTVDRQHRQIGCCTVAACNGAGEPKVK